MVDELNIGKKIRQLRLQKCLTLERIAHSTGFTKSYISMVERGKKSPPIASLSKIARALGVDIGSFFEQRKPEDGFILVRKEDRKLVVRNGTLFGYTYESIAHKRKRKKMEPFIITMPPRRKDGPLFDHEGEELFYVLEGRVEFLHNKKRYTLKEGDCIYFDSSLPHRGRSIGDKAAKALVVIYSS